MFFAIPVRFYGLLMALAILAAWFLALRLAPTFGIKSEALDEALPWVVGFGLLGARAYFVIFTWPHFAAQPIEILEVWKGGLAIYGAMLGGALGLFLYARRAGQPFLKILDLVALVMPLAQSIGRWGNFFNQEAFGRPTNLPWKIYISPEYRPAQYLQEKFFHPTFFYESLWDLTVFLILLRIAASLPTRERSGTLVAYYLILYPLGRFFIEFLRVDSFFISGFRVDQITSLVMMLTGAAIFYYAQIYEKSLS